MDQRTYADYILLSRPITFPATLRSWRFHIARDTWHGGAKLAARVYRPRDAQGMEFTMVAEDVHVLSRRDIGTVVEFPSASMARVEPGDVGRSGGVTCIAMIE